MIFSLKFFNLKLAAIATSTLASLSLLVISPARAALVEFDLQFFDNNDVQVGFGEFSYDDGYPLERTFLFQGFPELEMTAEDGWFELTSFSATIEDLSWGLEDSAFTATSWVASNFDNPLAGVSFARLAPLPMAEDFWIYGDPRFSPVMVMFPNRTWIQSGESGEPLGGMWVAGFRPKVVPEPTTTLLVSGLALGGGSLLKKRLKAAKTEANRLS
ncbi:MAG: PEP-CTERM sorting domain-containing protein [Cyanobacteriota bacterium]|nr:PEP-CTERM sorting domain-containing protein [Cyanobacteriota bacterium]